MERTLVLLKPDCVQRRLAGQIIGRFEEKGLNIIAMKMLRVTPDLAKRHYAEHEMFDLRYAGVAPEHRGHGIFRTLIAKVQSRLVPVTVIVPPHNRLGVAAALEKFGFRQTGSSGGERVFRWEPGT